MKPQHPAFQSFSTARLATTTRAMFAMASLATVSLCGGCASGDDNYHSIGRSVTRRTGEPTIFRVNDDDAQMARASRRSRRSVDQFIAALRNPPAGSRDFAVKKMFVQNGNAEHIWLTDVHFTGNRFVGRINNTPVEVKGPKLGDRVSVNPDEISDWLYVQNGRLVGGYTVRVLWSEMTPAEREQFEKESDFRVAGGGNTGSGR